MVRGRRDTSRIQKKFGLESHFKKSFENDTDIFVSKSSRLTGNTAVYVFRSDRLLDMTFDVDDDPEFFGRYRDWLLDIFSGSQYGEWEK